MATLRIIDHESLSWLGPRDEGEPDEQGLVVLPASDQREAIRYPHRGSETELYLHESRVPAGFEMPAHAHRESEIIYVLSGAMYFGSRLLTQGMSVFIPAMTLYGFRGGPNGARFLNFRGRQDFSHIEKADFMAARSQDSAVTGAS
jgi:hypothetical protein